MNESPTILIAAADQDFCQRTALILRDFNCLTIDDFAAARDLARQNQSLKLVIVAQTDAATLEFVREIKSDAAVLHVLADDSLETLPEADAVYFESENPQNLISLVKVLLRGQTAEKNLREKTERFRGFLQATNQIVWTSGGDGDGETALAEWWEEITGFNAAERKNRSWLADVHPQDRDQARFDWDIAVENQMPYRTEYRVKTKDGDFRSLQVRGIPLFNRDKTLREWIGTAIDTTENRRAEAALSQQTALLEISQEPVFVWDLESGIVSWNRGCEEIYGYDKSEAVGQASHELLKTVFPVSFENYSQTLEETGYWAGELRHHTKNGGEVVVESRQMLVAMPDGKQLILESNRDLTARQRAEKSARERENLLGAINDAAPTMIIVYDFVDGKIMYVNNWVRKMLGYAPDEMLALDQKQWLAKLHPDDAEKVTRQAKNLKWAKDGEILSLEYRYQNKKGDWCVIRSHDTIFKRGADDLPIQVLSVAEDITERRELLEQAETARRDAEFANRAKDEFLAVLSHELRTPLNAMYGWIRMMASETLDAAMQKRAVEVIERNINLQSKLIEDILDVSRIISGKITLEPIPVNLVSIVGSAAETARPTASLKQISIETAFDAEKIQIVADAERLQQVLSNLIGNAIKFTAPGGDLKITLEQFENVARIGVKDSGVGIAPDFLPHVFDRFRQADASSKRKHGGLGLGLAIVKHLIELHDGRVWAESAGENQGSTFFIELPLGAENASENETGINPAIDSTAIKNLRILIVEDDADALEMLKTLLETNGATISAARSGMEALKILNEKTAVFDLLISDIAMPEMDGVELIKTLRGDENRKNLRSIALTAYASPLDRQNFLAAGFDVCLSKPLNFNELQNAVAALLK